MDAPLLGTRARTTLLTAATLALFPGCESGDPAGPERPADYAEMNAYFQALPDWPDDAPLAPDVAQGLAADEARTVVAAFRDKLAAHDHLDEAVFKALMKEVQQSTKVKGKGLWGPVRWAITLEAEGPDLAQVAAVLGRERALARLERVLGG